jgi:hypothetical protein
VEVQRVDDILAGVVLTCVVVFITRDGQSLR